MAKSNIFWKSVSDFFISKNLDFEIVRLISEETVKSNLKEKKLNVIIYSRLDNPDAFQIIFPAGFFSASSPNLLFPNKFGNRTSIQQIKDFISKNYQVEADFYFNSFGDIETLVSDDSSLIESTKFRIKRNDKFGWFF